MSYLGLEELASPVRTALSSQLMVLHMVAKSVFVCLFVCCESNNSKALNGNISCSTYLNYGFVFLQFSSPLCWCPA